MSSADMSELDAHSCAQSDFLGLDQHTLKDLEIFETDSGHTSLYEFCNYTKTSGGANVLKRRMAQPWSKPERILATQQALRFIRDHRHAFNGLPTAFATGRVDHYSHEILPMITADNLFEFAMGVLSLSSNDDPHYQSIVRGVLVSCTLIQVLRQMIAQIELSEPAGELASLLDEMRALLVRPRLAQIPAQEVGGWGWRILRLDQVFRLHEKVAVARLLQIIYEIDALVAMADATDKHGFTLPQLEQGALRVYAEGLVHPFVDNAVANPVSLDQQRRVLFITGPNMAGKTTYMRAFATALYLAQLGMGVPASTFRFVPAQKMFSSISLSDDLRNGVSYFKAEALRVKAIASAIADGSRVVALMDEPFKGTNVKDALDASQAILQRFSVREQCLFMFSSHLIELGEQLHVNDPIDCCYFEADEGGERLHFNYTLQQGVSSQRLGMRVLMEEGVFALLDASDKHAVQQE